MVTLNKTIVIFAGSSASSSTLGCEDPANHWTRWSIPALSDSMRDVVREETADSTRGVQC